MITSTHKKTIEKDVKAVLKRYGVKGSLSRPDMDTLFLDIKEGCLDFARHAKHTKVAKAIANSEYYVNRYVIAEEFGGNAREFLEEVTAAMNIGCYDRARPETWDSALWWDSVIRIGRWDRPYKLHKQSATTPTDAPTWPAPRSWC